MAQTALCGAAANRGVGGGRAHEPSALHHRFKAVTAMSPLQYQKQLRLHEARRMMFSTVSKVRPRRTEWVRKRFSVQPRIPAFIRRSAPAEIARLRDAGSRPSAPWSRIRRDNLRVYRCRCCPLIHIGAIVRIVVNLKRMVSRSHTGDGTDLHAVYVATIDRCRCAKSETRIDQRTVHREAYRDMIVECRGIAALHRQIGADRTRSFRTIDRNHLVSLVKVDAAIATVIALAKIGVYEDVAAETAAGDIEAASPIDPLLPCWSIPVARRRLVRADQ